MGKIEVEFDHSVVGIDPASGRKGSWVYSPQIRDGDGILDRDMDVATLREHINNHFGTDSCLVCWDAPLTGPPYPDADNPGPMTMREIESTRKDSRYPEISELASESKVAVRPFSGLSHWVVSRNVLGLPRTGRFDAALGKLPFHPVTRKEDLAHHRYAVTEVHPALAVAGWLGRDEWQQYKGLRKGETQEVIGKLWGLIYNKLGLDKSQFSVKPELPNASRDDAFDARVAWLLGTFWLNGNGVTLFGSEHDGSFLLPIHQ